MNKRAAVFGQLAPEQFHDVRPGRDGVTGAETDTCRHQAVGQRLIARHDDLMARSLLAFHESIRLEDVVQGVTVAGMKGRQCIVQNALILAAESFRDELLQFGHIQVEQLGHQPENEHVFALVLASAANGFHGQ